MTQGPEDAPLLKASFREELGQILSAMADRHPNPDDETLMRYVTEGPDGEQVVAQCSLRQYAQAVNEGDDIGTNIVDFYADASRIGFKDPTGQSILDDLRQRYSLEQSESDN